ncbi:MAG: DUF3375 domain-containing protein [Anaerolineaceae bacterium]|nr:MAG: DUF3375 domain-containing protein [Anaerolineaceae bacterium]
MDYDTIAALYKNAPTFAALRKDWLPLAVSYLHYAFKRKHEVTLPQDVFREGLDAYLEHVNATLPDDRQHTQSASYYIDRWSRDDDLIRVRSRDDGYVVQLSPHAERLIGWFEEMQKRGIIGTESRLRTIMSMLDDVITHSTEDVAARLAQLIERRDQIDAEIERIEQTGEVDGLSDVQIRERLQHINSTASQLLRDFSAVEERFREMAREIQQAQLNPELRRGDILGTALDADERLEASDEGQSFRAFYEVLTHPHQRETFDNLLSALFAMPRLLNFVEHNATLQRLTSHLLEAGERVNQSNQRLAEHLRRVVDTRNVAESRRVQQLALEIKHIAGRIEAPDMLTATRRTFLTVEGDPIVDLPLERPLFEPPERVEAGERPRPASTHIDADALIALYDTFFIDQSALRENIARLLMSRSQVTLAEVVNSYPIRQGMAEVVAYVVIAAGTPQHRIERSLTDTIPIAAPDEAETRTVNVPRLIFSRQSQPEADLV